MVKEYRVSFATITILDENTASIMIDHGVEVDEEKFEELRAFELKHLQVPRLLLVDKKNSYFYSFAAQKALANNDHIWATAGLIYSKTQRIISRYLRDMADELDFNSKTFYNRDDALDWLRQQKEKYKSDNELSL